MRRATVYISGERWGEEERGWGEMEEEVGERQVASATSLSPYLPFGATETARSHSPPASPLPPPPSPAPAFFGPSDGSR
ncbi:hypothetical protein PPACK8108_LOCUS7581 [Phakopsora pachyrhizi]|uniref:Uncharacterized protein n=1 Tax=Phakopsora pachyrhizi TaxID=170000 RepID=A0AAV0AT73_PHAPC|nr:hypothetical protein PPACK8108_LOCUS7581 [Phakopsora pachyrhizi]